MNNLAQQVRELFESMTPGARLTAGMLLAVVVVSVGYLFQQSTAGPDEYLFGAEAMPASQINAMQAAMSKAGLNDFQVEGNKIRVPRGSRHAYIAAIADDGALPTHAKDFMADALSSGSVFDSAEVKRQRIKLALEKELSHTIGWMPWVQQASVVYDLQTSRGPRQQQQASATVMIKPVAGEAMDGRRAKNIQKLVAGGFANMKPDDVTINNMGGDDVGSYGDDIYAGDYESLYHRERVRIENEKRRLIAKQLSHIDGVKVQVNAILDEVIQKQSMEMKPDQQAVTISETTDSSNITKTTIDGGARPGLQANGPQGVGNTEAAARENKLVETNETSRVDNRVGETQMQETRAGLVAKEIQASVVVPREFVVNVWKQQQLSETGEVPENVDPEGLKLTEAKVVTDVESLVKPVLPKLVGESDYKQVNVVVIDTVPSDPLPEVSMASDALAWSSRHGNTIAMLGVALVSLLMLRSAVKSATPGGDGAASESPIALQLDAEGNTVPAGSSDGAGGEDGEEGERPKLKLQKADSLKDDLTDIVRSDPDAAAAILRTWIGKAS